MKKLPIKKTIVLTALMTGILTATAAEVTIVHKNNRSETVDLKEVAGTFYWITADNERVYFNPDRHTCEGTGCPQQQNTSAETLGVYGSNTIGAELMPALITGYANQLNAKTTSQAGKTAEEKQITVTSYSDQALLTVDLNAHGSGTAFPALAEKKAEIGMASRPIKQKEMAQLAEAGIKRMRAAGQEHVVALDGLAIVVSPNNPIDSLSIQQIAQLFAGEITNWSQVGGKDQPVTVYARDEKSGTYDTFKGLVLKAQDKKLSGKAKRFESNEALSDQVAKDEGGIGFTGFAYINNAKALSLLSDCGISYTPSEFGVKSEEYPLARRLYLYTTGKELSKHAQGLLDYSLSDSAQKNISHIGFINQSVEPLAYTQQEKRFTTPTGQNKTATQKAKELRQLLDGGNRLSTTFRFNTGSSELDVKAVRDIQRIATLISDADANFKDKTVYLLGFTDSKGGFNQNLALSESRAQKVLSELKGKITNPAAMNNLRAMGYSELSPIACNTDTVGQGKNRRVEIWVK